MQRSAPARTTRSYRNARPAVPRPLPRRGPDRKGLHALTSLLLVFALVVAGTVAFEVGMGGKIYPGVRVGGVDVGSLSRQEAFGRLAGARDIVSTRAIAVRAAGAHWTVTPRQLGFTVDVPGSVDAAYRLGRDGDLPHRLREQTRLMLEGRDMPLQGSASRHTLLSYLFAMAARVNEPSRSPVLALAPSGPVIGAPARAGARLNVVAAAPLLAAAAARGETGPITLPTIAVPPSISTASALRASARITRMLRARITVVADRHARTLSRADLIALLRATTTTRAGHMIYLVGVNDAAVARVIATMAPSVDRPGRDARVTFADGVVRVTPGRAGRAVDSAAAVARVHAAIDGEQTATVHLPISDEATVSNAEAQAVAARLRRTLRTTVVWLPRRHWALTPAQIAAALTLRRVTTGHGARLVPRLDPARIAADMPGSAALVTVPARDAAVVRRGGAYIVIPAVEGRRPNYEALCAEMLAAPPGNAVYHLPGTTYPPALTTAQARALARAHRTTAAPA